MAENKSDRFFKSLFRVRALAASTGAVGERLLLIAEDLKDEDVRREFFERIATSDWLVPLRDMGYFDNPPRGVEGGGRPQIKFWPPSRFLAKVAHEAPEEVTDIILQLQTENPGVERDIVAVADKLPAAQAVRLVPLVAHIVLKGDLVVNFKDACQLCTKLADAGFSVAALELAQTLFVLERDKNNKFTVRDEYWYLDGLSAVAPVLAAVSPDVFLRRLCGYLETVVRGMGPSTEDRDWDFSYSWRPAIEENAANSDVTFESKLVGVVRSTFEIGVEKGALNLPVVRSILESYRGAIFRRLFIHLVNRFAAKDELMTKNTILERTLLCGKESYWFEHEYALLVQNRFDMLAKEETEKWFSWVDEGPDDLVSGDEQRRNEFKAYWQFEKLHWAKEFLRGDRLAFYNRMLEKHSAPKSRAEVIQSRVNIDGMRSPFAVDDLKSKSYSDVVDIVDGWRPAQRSIDVPNVEGLGAIFGQLIASDAESWSRQAEILKGRHPFYVRTFIDRMATAARECKNIDLATVLRLCVWAVDRPINEVNALADYFGGFVDRDWQQCRDTVSHLIREICVAEKDGRRFYKLDKVDGDMLAVLSRLTHDSPKSYLFNNEEQTDLLQTDFLTYAINSPRGKAVDALLSCARWIANQRKVVKGKEEVFLGGFDAVPGLREMLDWQVSKENGSFVAWSLIGAHIGNLFWMDKEWTQKNVARLFDLSEIERNPDAAFGWGAWNGFLVWGQPFVELYELLKPQFAYAIKKATQVEPKGRGRENPFFRLGEQLMILYGRGDIGLETDGGMLRQFLSDANIRIRSHAINFAGRVLQGEQNLPANVIERFMRLWEWYWPNVAKNDVAAAQDKSLFGWWFVSGRLPAVWALQQLRDFVGLVGVPEPDHMVIEKLAEIASKNIKMAVEIVAQMERADAKGEGWHVTTWIEGLRKILELGIGSGGEVSERAKDLIDCLGRRGLVEFGDILGTKGGVT